MAETTDAEGQGIPEKDLLIFHPTETSRAILRSLADESMVRAMDQFFALWIEQSSPREAGSVVAAAFMQTAARMAVVGAMFDNQEPDIDQWLAVARERFDEAMIAAKEAFDQAAAKRKQECPTPDKSES